MPRARDVTERFHEKVYPDPNSGCWLWGGAIGTHGYGVIGCGPHTVVTTHRLSWLLHRGEIPAGMFVLHKCDNRPCCNPNHLYVGTVKDNSADMLTRRGPTGFKKGHTLHHEKWFRDRWIQNMPRGARHHRSAAKLTEAQVIEIFNAQESQAVIAKRFGVSQSCVSTIKLKIRWRHLHANAS